MFMTPRPNLTITSYNASVVKYYNATNSKRVYRIKIIVFYCISALAHYNAVAVNLKVVGLATGSHISSGIRQYSEQNLIA
jgi:hypothetical protein